MIDGVWWSPRWRSGVTLYSTLTATLLTFSHFGKYIAFHHLFKSSETRQMALHCRYTNSSHISAWFRRVFLACVHEDPWQIVDIWAARDENRQLKNAVQFLDWKDKSEWESGEKMPPPIIITSEVPSREALSPTTGVLWKMRDLLKKKRHVIMSVKILRNPGHGSLTCFSQTGFNEINEIIHLSSLTEPDLVTWVFNPEDCHEIRLLAFVKALCNTETKALMRLEYTERNCQWGWFMTRSLDSSSVSDPAAASGSTLGSTLVLNLLLDVSWSLS